MNRFTCDWIFNQLVVLCDGKVVCGCADPNGERPLGHLKDNTLMEIWNSPEVQTIRCGLNHGWAPFCLPCGLKKPLGPEDPLPHRDLELEVLPRIFLEPTVVCNLSCYGAVCSRESGILKTRSRLQFPPEELPALLEEAGQNMVRIDFFNYGDPFCHPQALEMIEWIKTTYPHIYLYISTNGLLLDGEKSGRLIAAGVDEITFSVDGADQETYAKYRRGGDFQKVLGIMKTMMRLRSQAGAERPFVNWRAILFRWNDSRRQMNRIRRLAGEAGVDRLNWEITDHPEDAYSRRYVAGSRAWKRIYHEIWDTSQIGSALTKKRFLAAFRSVPSRIEMPNGETNVHARITVENRGGALWKERTRDGRRLVRLGAQLYSNEGERLDLNYARAFLPRDISNREKVTIGIDLPAPEHPGEYRIKWDMVGEGVDWFENGGSPVAWSRLTAK